MSKWVLIVLLVCCSFISESGKDGRIGKWDPFVRDFYPDAL